MAHRIILFDLETSGLPDRSGLGWNQQPAITDITKYDTARVVQIGLKSVLYWIDKKTHKHVFMSENKFNIIIKPIDFKITNAHIHNITQEIAEAKGILFKNAIARISPLFDDASLIISHNISFDANVLMSEMYRQKLYKSLNKFKEIPQFCTARMMTSVMQLSMSYCNNLYYKTPSLTEMYEWLFKRKISCDVQLHNALTDVEILFDCFRKMVTQQIIELN